MLRQECLLYSHGISQLSSLSKRLFRLLISAINPQNDGTVIRLTFPQLTEDRRKELVKEIKKMGEECKVAIRSIRRDAMEKFKAMKKNNEITEDDLKDCEDEIQKLTDRFVKEVDGHVAEKEKEILSI